MNTYKIGYRRFAESFQPGDVYEIKAVSEKVARTLAENRISTDFQKIGFPYPKIHSIEQLD